MFLEMYALCNKQANCHSFHGMSLNLAFDICIDEQSNNNKIYSKVMRKMFSIEQKLSYEIAFPLCNCGILKNYHFFQCEWIEKKLNNQHHVVKVMTLFHIWSIYCLIYYVLFGSMLVQLARSIWMKRTAHDNQIEYLPSILAKITFYKNAVNFKHQCQLTCIIFLFQIKNRIA